MELQFARRSIGWVVAALLTGGGCGGSVSIGFSSDPSGAAAKAGAIPSGQAVAYHSIDVGELRGFNFDGDQPFVDPGSGRSDIESISFDGIVLENDAITNAGSGTVHVTRVFDEPSTSFVTRVRLLDTDNPSIDGYRTQINSYRFDPYKTYLYELEFRLAQDWDFAMPLGAGLLWQVKGDPKPGQWGNPVMALNLIGRRLRFNLLYPSPAMRATAWPLPLQWGDGEYVAVPVPEVELNAGQYFRLQILFHADDRPIAVGGRGFVVAWVNDSFWFRHDGPTLHPDQNGRHRTDFGWYQWEGKPMATRTIDFRKARLYEWR